MNKNKVLETLEVMGFEIKEVPDLGFVFEYERLTLIFIPDDDEDCLRFVAPNIFDVTDENRVFVLDFVNEINLSIKYSKVCVYGEHVWAFYEYLIFDDSNLEKIIEHCLLLLGTTVAVFHRKVEGEDIEDINDEGNIDVL